MGEIKWVVIDNSQKITTKERKLLNDQLSHRIAIEADNPFSLCFPESRERQQADVDLHRFELDGFHDCPTSLSHVNLLPDINQCLEASCISTA